MLMSALLCYLGEAEDGSGDATSILLAGRGHVCDWGYRVSCAGASQERNFQGEGEAGECLRCGPPNL